MAIPTSILFGTFTVTVAIESILVSLLLIRQQRTFFTLVVVLVIHIVTHPVGAVVYYVFHTDLLLVEIIVVLLEAILYWRIFSTSLLSAFMISIIVNMASFFLGPAVRAAIL